SRAGFGAAIAHPPAHDVLVQDRPVDRVVVDREHAQAAQIHTPAWRRARRQTKRDGEPERAALSGLALDADLASHQLDEPGRDGETKSGSAVFPRRRDVGLGERYEQLRLLRG